MFILDLYRFCESWRKFNRQQFAVFVFRHRECERMARAAGVSPRFFASMVSKECLARWATLGYLNLKGGSFSSKGPDHRPVNFEFESFKGRDSVYMLEMMNIGKLNDEALFGREDRGLNNGGASTYLSESALTRAILECRSKLIAYCNARDSREGA